MIEDAIGLTDTRQHCAVGANFGNRSGFMSSHGAEYVRWGFATIYSGRNAQRLDMSCRSVHEKYWLLGVV
jgi:hypothetical protein